MKTLGEILPDLTVWILSDGKIGHVNQSIGVAEELGVNFKTINLEPTKYAKILGRINGSLAVKNKLSAPWPDMIIATGTLPALVSGWIKQQSPKTVIIQIMTPPNKHYLYDVIAVPSHDKIKNKANVIRTIGAPNKITKNRLIKAKKHWKKEFASFENPLAVLIGGSNKNFIFTDENAKKFAKDIIKFAQLNNFSSLLVTSSRRTGEKQAQLIREILKGSKLPVNFWCGENKNNPYFAYLSYAKAVVVTADSIGMISESCTANLPVIVYGIENMQSRKFKKFFKIMLAKNLIKSFKLNKMDLSAAENPLSDTQVIVGAVSGVLIRKYNFIG